MTPKYKRLPGRRRGIIRNGSLWAADDHLLAIDSWRFTEQYKRYYFADIQSITLERKIRVTLGPLFWSLGLTALACGSLSVIMWLALTTTARFQEVPEQVWRYYDFRGQATAVVFLAVILYQILCWIFFSCECRIRTATSSDELRSLHRYWKAVKALRMIDERIRAEQGLLPPDWKLRLAEASQPVPPEASAVAAPDSGSPVAAIPQSHYLSAFTVVMALTAACGLWRFLAPSRVGDHTLTVLLVSGAIFAITYAIRLKGQTAKIMMAFAAAGIVVLASVYVVETAYSFRHAMKTSAQKDRGIEFIAGLFGSPNVERVPSAGAILLGVGGMMLAVRMVRNPQS